MGPTDARSWESGKPIQKRGGDRNRLRAVVMRNRKCEMNWETVLVKDRKG